MIGTDNKNQVYASFKGAQNAAGGRTETRRLNAVGASRSVSLRGPLTPRFYPSRAARGLNGAGTKLYARADPFLEIRPPIGPPLVHGAPGHGAEHGRDCPSLARRDRRGGGYVCPYPRNSFCARRVGGSPGPGRRPRRGHGPRRHPGRKCADPWLEGGDGGAGRYDGWVSLWAAKCEVRAAEWAVGTSRLAGPTWQAWTSRMAPARLFPSTRSARNRRRTHGDGIRRNAG